MSRSACLFCCLNPVHSQGWSLCRRRKRLGLSSRVSCHLRGVLTGRGKWFPQVSILFILPHACSKQFQERWKGLLGWAWRKRESSTPFSFMIYVFFLTDNLYKPRFSEKSYETTPNKQTNNSNKMPLGLGRRVTAGQHSLDRTDFPFCPTLTKEILNNFFLDPF